jgi:hypothetical protein
MLDTELVIVVCSSDLIHCVYVAALVIVVCSSDLIHCFYVAPFITVYALCIS